MIDFANNPQNIWAAGRYFLLLRHDEHDEESDENIRDDDSPDVVALQPYFNTIFSFFIEEPSLPDNFYVDIKVLFDNYS